MSSLHRYTRSAAAAGVLSLATSACSFEEALGNIDICSGGSETISSLTLAPDRVSLRVGDQLQLSADRRGRNDETIILCGPTWSWNVTDSKVAQFVVDQSTQDNGWVYARAVGTTEVTVSSGGKTARSVVTVIATPIASMRIEPQLTTLGKGQTLRLSVAGFDASGNKLDVRTVTWSSDASAVATISSVGWLTAVDTGTVTVRATSENITAESRIAVTLDGPTMKVRQISAGYQHTCAIAGLGNVAEGRLYCWGDNSGDSLELGARRRISSQAP